MLISFEPKYRRIGRHVHETTVFKKIFSTVDSVINIWDDQCLVCSKAGVKGKGRSTQFRWSLMDFTVRRCLPTFSMLRKVDSGLRYHVKQWLKAYYPKWKYTWIQEVLVGTLQIQCSTCAEIILTIFGQPISSFIAKRKSASLCFYVSCDTI